VNKSKKQIEAEIENAYVIYALSRGVNAAKFINPNETGGPDRINLCPGRHVFFIEFKAPGEKPNPKQLWYHKLLIDKGFTVYVCDSYESAVNALEYELKTYVDSR
jgi:hypothetical protein